MNQYQPSSINNDYEEENDEGIEGWVCKLFLLIFGTVLFTVGVIAWIETKMKELGDEAWDS